MYSLLCCYIVYFWWSIDGDWADSYQGKFNLGNSYAYNLLLREWVKTRNRIEAVDFFYYEEDRSCTYAYNLLLWGVLCFLSGAFDWLPMQTWFCCWNAAALPAQTNGYIRVDCYGGLNQMRRDVSIVICCSYTEFPTDWDAMIKFIFNLFLVAGDLQLCDGVGIARLLNATLVLPKFEVAAYWNESRYAIVMTSIFVSSSLLTYLIL